MPELRRFVLGDADVEEARLTDDAEEQQIVDVDEVPERGNDHRHRYEPSDHPPTYHPLIGVPSTQSDWR